MNEPNINQQDSMENMTNQYDALVADISSSLTTRLSELMSKLLNSAQDKLFKMSDESNNNKDRTRYFELMNQLRVHKPVIADNFRHNITEYLLPANEFELKQLEKKSSDNGELSLVDQDDMEGMVLVRSVGERTAAKYREQLSHLETRLEDLATKTKSAFKPDALTPFNLCQAFDDALAENFDNENKKILFGMFDAEVAGKLDDLYDSINKSLIDAGILPQIKLRLDKQKSEDPRPSPSTTHTGVGRDEVPYGNDAGKSSDNDDRGNSTRQTGGSNINGFAMTAAPGANYHNANQNSSSLHTADMRSSENGQYQHYTAGMPASHVSQILSNFIGASFTPEATAKPAADNNEFFPQSTRQHFGHQEIIQALSSIQSQPQFYQQETPHFDGEMIKQAVLEAIAKTSGGAVTKSINNIAEKTIDFIELIFDAIIDDDDISDTIKTLLLRLQIPIIKASMSDQEFFIYDNHPARVLLDTIAEIGVGVSKHTDDVYIYLDKTVSNILGEYEISTKTFQSALDKLNAYVAEQEKLISAKEDEEQKQLLRKHARATVLKSLRATTTGKILPEAIHPLVLKRWPTLMFNHYLANGKENNEWINIVLTLRHIVDSVQPITSATHLAKVISERDELFEQTEHYLNVCSNSKKDVQNIMAIYAETVQNLIDDANFTQDEVSSAKENIDTAETAEVEAVEEVTDKPSIPPNIVPGMWFQLYMGENQTIRRCKLSVILVEDANLMFVNHKGELVVEKSFDQFNEEVATNRTKMIMGHSTFENAFKTVINRLN